MDLEEQKDLRKKHRRARKMMLLFSLLSITMTFAGLTSAFVVSKSRADWLKDFQLPTILRKGQLLSFPLFILQTLIQIRIQSTVLRFVHD